MSLQPTLASAVSAFGAAVKVKLTAKAITGAPEDQLRGPLETFIQHMSALAGHKADTVVAVGETTLSGQGTRPDYAISVGNALTGFIEVKAPGKGADPRTFTDRHDGGQWKKLKALPNLIYTDGNAFSLWRDGNIVGSVVHLEGDIATAGAKLVAPESLQRLFSDFLSWAPIAPRNAEQLAEVSARLCRLLRDEVTEELAEGNATLTDLAKDWRAILFPYATNEEFADGYAQAVTFGLLMARAQNIPLSNGLEAVAKALGQATTVIGSAFRVLTDHVETHTVLKTSLNTLTRVLGVVDWAKVSAGKTEAWLYFYEHFLAVYDNVLRRRTGSYYTPPEIVTTMVRLVDDLLRDPDRFGVPVGLASPDVTIADPAVGTGTYLLGLLRRIAEITEADQGEGSIGGVVLSALKRLIGFELQFGPFAVAQLRLLAEVADLAKLTPDKLEDVKLRLHITDTLGNPAEGVEFIPSILKPLAASRLEANTIKRTEPIMIVMGNPPYKEKAKGRGGWIEGEAKKIKTGGLTTAVKAPLLRWIPPKSWGVSAHTKHLRNLYVYFWRWATWKVFGDSAQQLGTDRKGVVSFITVAGFLNGPGFQAMRDDLRRSCDEIWVIDCSPDGHQPAVSTRIFQGVQQPVCIVMAASLGQEPLKESGDGKIVVPVVTPARVKFRSLPKGNRQLKFDALKTVTLDGDGWLDCPTAWRAPFLPALSGSWATYPALENLFSYNGSGVMPGRTWVIAPDADSLKKRWATLAKEKDEKAKEVLFHPHMKGKEFGDRHTKRVISEGLSGHELRTISVDLDTKSAVKQIPYAFRSFDRQWIIPDNRLINRPNPTLWDVYSSKQIYITAPFDRSPTNGPGLTFTSLIPDLHHYNGRGGRVFPLWADAAAKNSNVSTTVLKILSEKLAEIVTPENIIAYIAAVMAHPGYPKRFAENLVQPGLRVPVTLNSKLFGEATKLGREVIWLHTFGDRCVSVPEKQPAGPPRMAKGTGPIIPGGGAIPVDEDGMPQEMTYDAKLKRLKVGGGYIDNVPPEVWGYQISGTHVISHWFSYRCKDRTRPIIGDRREPSPLGHIQPPGWLSEYTTELLNVLHVLGRLVALEPAQADLLERICAAATLEDTALTEATPESGAPRKRRSKAKNSKQLSLLT